MNELLHYIVGIIRIEERQTQIHESGTGPEAKFRLESSGWWITINFGLNSISLPCGPTRPDLKEGRARFTLDQLP